MHNYTLCFIKKGHQILMLNRLYSPNMGKWNGVGGKIEAGETPQQSVIREVYEETGLSVDNPELVGTVTWILNDAISGMYVYISSIPTSTDFSTPVNVAEGILDWKDIDWVLNVKNTGIADNVQEFLPVMLNGENVDHRFSYNVNEEMIDYIKLPLTV
ncbi:NUDIX hydrolase [Paenibacillus eucommiae]|uniref:8-oxo-dGTP diphosphatase n=1 Tax=Paenibacillus eucommiae TaxID=1355755 RepID=A0ABS4JA10_9BACL|nr:8-oxo-dGTP diphosphatase [Paenibacillus eucommiae]MBP1996683.1 8-oxo-dGTP diphosphatase [Paenibacillus eucommiae]